LRSRILEKLGGGQASECCREQQHRWPAYNVNIAPPQASTVGLFQQTRLITFYKKNVKGNISPTAGHRS